MNDKLTRTFSIMIVIDDILYYTPDFSIVIHSDSGAIVRVGYLSMVVIDIVMLVPLNIIKGRFIAGTDLCEMTDLGRQVSGHVVDRQPA